MLFTKAQIFTHSLDLFREWLGTAGSKLLTDLIKEQGITPIHIFILILAFGCKLAKLSMQ